MIPVDIDVTLKVNTAICIGSGVSASTMGVDKVTLKDKEGNLFIPASTFKGRLRSRCEKILNSIKVEVCHSPRAEDMCPHYFLKCYKTIYYCPICEIFGSPWKESPLRFEDLIWRDPDWRDFNTDVRPGTSISRRRGVVEEQRLFFTETSAPNAQPEFNGKITGKVKDEKELALLMLGLRDIRELGSSKSRGLGWCIISFEPENLSKEQIAEAMKGWKNGKKF